VIGTHVPELVDEIAVVAFVELADETEVVDALELDAVEPPTPVEGSSEPQPVRKKTKKNRPRTLTSRYYETGAPKSPQLALAKRMALGY
jgi:hypothetical protein